MKNKKEIIKIIFFLLVLVFQVSIIYTMITSHYYRVFYIENVLVSCCIGFVISNIKNKIKDKNND